MLLVTDTATLILALFIFKDTTHNKYSLIPITQGEVVAFLELNTLQKFNFFIPETHGTSRIPYPPKI